MFTVMFTVCSLYVHCQRAEAFCKGGVGGEHGRQQPPPQDGAHHATTMGTASAGNTNGMTHHGRGQATTPMGSPGNINTSHQPPAMSHEPRPISQSPQRWPRCAATAMRHGAASMRRTVEGCMHHQRASHQDHERATTSSSQQQPAAANDITHQ